MRSRLLCARLHETHVASSAPEHALASEPSAAAGAAPAVAVAAAAGGSAEIDPTMLGPGDWVRAPAVRVEMWKGGPLRV